MDDIASEMDQIMFNHHVNSPLFNRIIRINEGELRNIDNKLYICYDNYWDYELCEYVPIWKEWKDEQPFTTS